MTGNQFHLAEKDIENLEKLDFAKDGSIHCKGCRTGFSGKGGEDSVAKNFNDKQKVTTWGERGFGTFSTSPNRKGFIHRVWNSSESVYLNAYGKGGRKQNGYGPIKIKSKVENGITKD